MGGVGGEGAEESAEISNPVRKETVDLNGL